MNLNMNNYLKVNGVIIKKRKINDRDILFTILTKEYGKISTIYFGINKSNKKEKLSIDNFTLSEFVLKFKKDVETNILNSRIEEVHLIKSFSNIKKNIYSINFLFYVSYFIQNICLENKEEPEIYNRLINLLNFLNENNNIFNKNMLNLYISFYILRSLYDLGIYDIEELEKSGIKSLEINSIFKSINSQEEPEDYLKTIYKLEKYLNLHMGTNINYQNIIFI